MSAYWAMIRARDSEAMAGDHYIQAALMGQWGEPATVAARDRSIAVRMKKPAKILTATPARFGKENNLYPDWLEKLWQVYEGGLVNVINKLQSESITYDEALYLLLHVAALKPRGVNFLEDLNAYERETQLPVTADAEKLALGRADAFLATAHYASDWRWRVLHPADGEIFILGDQGHCVFSETDPKTGKRWPGSGAFFPLNPTLGILGFKYEKKLHRSTYIFNKFNFSERYTLKPGFASRLNDYQWIDAQRFIVGRPGDEALLNRLDVRPSFPSLSLGPYRFRHFGFFGD